MKGKTLLIAIILAFFATGCATNTAQEQAAESNQDPRDPFESANRVMWDFNYEILDEYIMRPVTVGYITVVPQFARTGLLNAANNLEEPINIINNLLQWKPGGAVESFARFLINSTVGVLGTIDVATQMGVARHDEDFDEVLGVWGFGNGPYVMLPAMGPSDARGVTGDVVDDIYFPDVGGTPLSIARIIIQTLESRANLMGQEQQLENSPDPYAFVKNAYFQNKAFQVNDGKTQEKEIDEEELEDFEAFESMLDDL